MPAAAASPHPTTSTDPQRLLPPRLLPILYFGFAHVALITALAAVAFDARSVAGFFYHPRMLAIVHLLTLGWISSSILGALYVVGPLALRMPMPAGRSDYWAYAFVVIGSAGMVSHFWIEEFSGMAWSALTALGGLAIVGARVVGRLHHAKIQSAVKLHIALAFFNLLGAAALGTLLGFDKTDDVIPGYALANVSAHAHLAAIGWAAMMVVGVGYRLLPMVLPSAIPEGKSVYLSAVLLEIGAVGLFLTLLLQSPWATLFALMIIAGLLVFGLHVRWMMRHRRPAPVARVRPEYVAGQAILALAYMGVASILGTVLVVAPPAEWEIRAVLLYGVLGLVGFLAQMIVGMEGRVMPWLAWYWAFANTAFKGPVPSPYQMSERSLQRWAFHLWLVGVPGLAVGFWFEAIPLVVVASWTLLVAAILGTLNAIRILRHAFSWGRPRAVGQSALPAERGSS